VRAREEEEEDEEDEEGVQVQICFIHSAMAYEKK